MLFDILQFNSEFLMLIERTFGCPHNHQFVGQLAYWLQLLLLQFAQVPIYPVVPHVLRISFYFLDEILVRDGGVVGGEVTHILIVHQDLFPHQSQLLNFSLQLSVLGDKCFVDHVEFCLHRQLHILQNMVDLCPKNCKVILHPGFLFLDLFLHVVYVLLLVSKQEHQLFWEDVRLTGQLAQVGGLTTRHRHSRTGKVVFLRDGVAVPLDR
jgi:hypothetical protein